MTTPSGQISLNDVNVELGIPGTTVITMNDAAVRTLAGVGGSGTVITMQNLQGKSNRVTASATISANTSNYTLNTAKAPGYSSGKTDMTLTISPSIYVSSSSTGSYALQVDTSWNAADTVTIVNNGIIIGRGGNGGGGGWNSTGGFAGSPAGPALLVQRALTMNNLNRISGGGGGGGGGSYNAFYIGKTLAQYSGGSGGGGIGVASGGTNPSSAAGTPGTLTSAGPGGAGGPAGPGGAGGTYGTSGANGGASAYSGGTGGGAGACIVGNSNITYTNTGTRNGSIS
jgi:hypothetical protein